MTVADVFETALAVIASVGGGGLIVYRLSGWLGRVWAERLMERERQQFREDLERLRAELAQRNARELEAVRAEWDLLKGKLAGAHTEKIALYRMVTDLLAPMVADLVFAQQGLRLTPEEAAARVTAFEKSRLRAYGYLAMFAPQAVMDAHDAVMDCMLGALDGSVPFDFFKLRTLAIAMLNAIRVDLGIDARPIQYSGVR